MEGNPPSDRAKQWSIDMKPMGLRQEAEVVMPSLEQEVKGQNCVS